MSVRDRIKRMEQIAMQEKEAAPDERGRSPGGVSMASNTSASGSPRPLSKVRTSFVAIADKDGRIGLARQPSGDSSVSGRQLSSDADAAASTSSILLENNNSRPNVYSSSPDAIRAERNRGSSGSFSRAALQDAGPGSTPEQTTAGTASGTASAEPVSGLAGPGADSQPVKSAQDTACAQSAGPAQPSGPTSSSTPSESLSTSVSGSGHGPIADLNPSGLTANSTLASADWATGTKGQNGLAASPQITEASRSKETASRHTSAGTAAAGQGQVVEESKAQRAGDQGQAQTKGRESARDRSSDRHRPTTGNGSTGANASGANAGGVIAGGATPALNGADKAKTTKPASTSSTHQKPAGKAPEAKESTTPAAEKKATEKKAAPSTIFSPFVKPRPKSPTQPVKLPERLTTHTTASATRTKNGAPPPAHANRPASRTSMGSSGKTLGRSSSVTGRQHSSFGPPPKQADHPVAKEVKPVDESFLARMMRPTQAYANKVADKAQLPPKTPPRTTATRKPASARIGPAKKVPKSTTTSAAASPETNKSEQSSAVKHVSERVEKPIAEEALPMAKKVEEKPASVKSAAPVDKTPAEMESVPEVAEQKEDVSKPSGNSWGSSKSSEKEDSGVKLPESSGPTSESFEKADASQANGNHKEESTGANAEVETQQPLFQSVNNGSVGGSQPQQVEQEEW